MDPYIRVGRPFTRAELDALRLDGLLVAVTDECFVPSETPLTPECRAGALEELPGGLAYSHGTAAWIWWEAFPLRAERDCSTTRRRRVRAAPLTRLVHETSLGPGDSATLSGRLVTSPGRTLFDVLRGGVLAEQSAEHWRDRLASVGEEDRRAFREYLDAAYRRPHALAVRRLADAALQPPLMR